MESHVQPAGHAHGQGHGEDHGRHPGPKVYVLIGLILTIVTAAEIAVYYIDALNDWSAAIIIPLSMSKFLLVVMFYMHLKFDSRLLTAVFAACGVLAIMVIVGFVILFRVLPYQALG
jgi:cytochrome c oxidase subunit 4